ncbi:uncharacterized protein LOC126978193 [Leptidea sinapis]|uniref:uncharacterized protein LOC126978193 n=1 Tax=Leptidea sinapis TaxID=189913 RepID=UPI00213FA5CA|nr:uncharacterized protein LOC126978193 [Leptidea sinapis]
MFVQPILIVLFVNSIESAEKHKQMIGVDTVQGIKIDKDTIITRNVKLTTKRKNEKKADTGNPDWSYSSIPKEISNHVNDFKRNMTECLKEVQANDKRTVKRLSPKTESPVHGECLIACVLKRNGVIEDGKVHKDNLMQLVSKFYGKEDKIMKKLEKNLDRCITKSIKTRDECVVAAQLNECTNGIMANNKHKITVNY